MDTNRVQNLSLSRLAFAYFADCIVAMPYEWRLLHKTIWCDYVALPLFKPYCGLNS